MDKESGAQNGSQDVRLRPGGLGADSSLAAQAPTGPPVQVETSRMSPTTKAEQQEPQQQQQQQQQHLQRQQPPQQLQQEQQQQQHDKAPVSTNSRDGGESSSAHPSRELDEETEKQIQAVLASEVRFRMTPGLDIHSRRSRYDAPQVPAPFADML